ncbi:hypothetical protein BH10PSE12_BH10PSE12_25670 [soil metagenome]
MGDGVFMTILTPLRIAMLLAPALALSACATVSPEAKVRAGLEQAGIAPPMADCMARKMVKHLSVDQLRRLKSFASVRNADMGRVSMDTMLHKLRALDDPEIFSVTSRAALSCAISS